MKNRKLKAEMNLGDEGLEKVKKNRKFVESYEGIEMFDTELIEVRHDIEKGYHVVAKTDIPKGTMIIEEKAQFYAPLKYESHFPGYCLNCLVIAKEPGGFIPCRCCPVAMYCSKKCLELHSIDHSLECGWMNLIESFPEA